MKRTVNKKIKRNKYRLAIVGLVLVIILIASLIFRNQAIEAEIAKYDNEILIVKGNGDQLDSLTLGEIRKSSPVKKTISLNNGLEKVDIEGVAIEKILGKLDFTLKDKQAMVIEDNEGNFKRMAMSAALEPDRVYLVYKINGTPIYDLSPAYGKFALIDSTAESSTSWITNVKTINIQ